MPTFITGDGDDVVVASDRNDLIQTNGGDDEIRARRGNDVVYAGDGNDFADGGDGRDVIHGEGGNDEILGGAGDDTIRGGDGNDTLSGGNDDDDVDGGTGIDTIDGGSGADRLFGGANRDAILTGAGADLVHGGSGDDNIDATVGSAGDRIYGDGYESLDDFLAGNPVTTAFGNDSVVAGGGQDTIYGDSGLDGVAGGDDQLFGGAGSDQLYGEGGNDYLDGGDGADTLNGGYGDDALVGSRGADVLTGGAGRDRFLLQDATHSTLRTSDRITDFVRGEDRIDLTQLPELLGGDKLAWGGTTPTARGVWYTQSLTQTFVFASTNGDTVADLRIVLDGLHNLTPTDFHGVIGSNGPPTLANDFGGVIEDETLVSINGVLSNDSGEDDIRVVGVSFGGIAGTLGTPLQGQYGSIVLEANGLATYTLDNNSAAVQLLKHQEVAQDVFTYTVTDAGGTAQASIVITIVGTNSAPVATNTSVVTNEDTPKSGVLPAATDSDGDTITYSLGTQAAHGTAAVNADGTFTFTPNAGFFGADAFTFVVSDSSGVPTNEYTVGVTVNEVNAAPFVVHYSVPAGIVSTPIGPGQSNDIAAGMVLQPDGKILLAGQSTLLATNQDFSIARYNPDGSFDAAFGNGGIAITPVGFFNATDVGTSVALQADGKILVAGYAGVAGQDFALVRYNANGTLDTTFGGGDGIVTTSVGAGAAQDQALHLAVQSDGKIVLVGSTQAPFTPPLPPGPPAIDTAIVRYNADGSLDTTFGGGDGIVITTLAAGAGAVDAAQAVLSQPDGGILVAGYSFTSATGQDFALLRYTSSGELDTTFGGGDGIVVTPVSSGNLVDAARSLLQQPDGRIVLAGSASTIGNSDFALVRYNADGSLDTTFGIGGTVITPIAAGGGPDAATSIARQPDGKLLVAGWTIGSNSDFAIVRYNENGSRDTTFGSNGVVVTNIGPGSSQDTAVGVSVQSDGKIVVGGHASSAAGANLDFALVRYNADGSLDATFHAEERLLANEGSLFGYTVPADRFADPDGDALTLSATQSNGNALPSWLTFDAATRTMYGTVPAGFADVHVRIIATDPSGLSASYAYWINTNAPPTAVAPSGVVTTNVSGSVTASALPDAASAIALQSDGKILLAGFAIGAALETSVTRYNTDGSLDLTFSGDGVALINTNSEPLPSVSTDTGRGLIVQPDGKILVVSSTTTIVGGNDIALSRLNANGTLDTTFGGGDGIVTTSIAAGTGNDTAASVTLQANGKILVTGMTTTPTGGGEIALVRYNADGSLDTTFDGDGVAIAGIGPGTDEGFSVKTQADGKIVVAGYGSVAPSGTAILVARFNANGSLDTTFSGDGIVTTDIGPGTQPLPESGQSLAILPDGRILVVGHGLTATGGLDIALVRYSSDGSLDTSFGAGGIVITSLAAGTAPDLAFGVALQADGRIVIAGATVTASGGGDMLVARYNADGSLDTTFGGGDGIVVTPIAAGVGTDQALGVVVQLDGKIVIGGSAFGAGSTDHALVRYNADGLLDTTFGGIGNPTVELGKAFSWVIPPQAFADADNDALTYSLTAADGSALPSWLTFDGRKLTGTPPNGATDLALRVTATDFSGAAAAHFFVLHVEDPNVAPVVASYGVPAGIVLTPIAPGQSNDGATGMVMQPDGKILLAGSSSPLGTGQDFSLARYNADGSFDTTFGTGGVAITPVSFGTTADTGTSIALQTDGKVLVAGWTITGSGIDFALLRYNANGTLDTTFGGGDGIVITPVGPGIANDQALHLAVQNDGKIVVVGSTQPASGPPGPPAQDIALVRYNADGSLDATFGAGGIVITPAAPAVGPDAARAVLSQADGGILVAGSIFFSATGDDFALVRYTATGALDTTFGGGDGIVTTAVVPSADQARAILQQPDGRIVIAGAAFPQSPTPTVFALARYNADGSPDSTFGTGGVVMTQLGASASSGASIARQADGKLLVAGSTLSSSSGNDFAIVRYNVNGTVDTTFGTNGVVVTTIGPGTSSDTALAISVQTDGKIVVGGTGVSAAGNFDFALARYNADGSLDGTFRAEQRLVANEGASFSHTVPADRFADADGDVLTYSAKQSDGSVLPAWLTFDAATRTFSGTAPPGSADAHVRVTATDPSGLSASYAYWIYTNSAPVATARGFVTTNVAGPLIASDQANAIALQADGKIVAVGLTGPSPISTDIAVARYTADGSIDLGFGDGDGITTINIAASGTETGRGVVVQPDGRIVVAGTTPGLGNDIALSRLNADGTLDTSFGGGDGIVTTAISAGSDTGNSITLQADGKILVSGMSNGDLTLVRYNADGSLDATFDLDGIAIAGVGPGNDEGLSVKTQTDGKIVVSGYSAIAAGSAFLVARFNVDGSRDTTFGTNGIVATDITAGPTPIPPFQEAGQALAILPDGRILVVGQAPTATSPSDIALVRYLSNGSLDTSFGTGGIVTTAAGTAQETGFGVALQPDGRIIVAGGNFTPTSGPNIAVLRYNADGTLDTTFGGSGIVTTSIATGLGSDQALTVALQPDGRIVIGGISFSPIGTLSLTNDFTLVRYNPDGSLDTTFGGIGNPTVEVGKAFAWTVPPRAFTDADTDALTYTITKADGTPLPAWLTVTGSTLSGTPPTGTTDLTLRVTATDPWGAAATQLLELNVEDPNTAPVVNYAVPVGIVQTPIGPGVSSDVASGLVVQPDGKIVLSGTSISVATAQDFSLARYNPDGSLDTTFGGGGIVITPLTPGTDTANSVALQADGKLLVAGVGTGPDFALVRYDVDGSLDTTFGGGDGIVTTTVATGFARDEALRVTVQSDGKIVVVGFAQNASGFPPPPSPQFADIAVARYNADGSLDATFGTGGIVKTEIGTGVLADVAQAAFVQADGGIVVAGYTTSTTTAQDFVLVRYTATGALDTTFGGGDGIVVTTVTPSGDQARSILQQPDGRIVVVGHALNGSDFALARYNVDGTPDTTFGTNGVVVHSVSGGTDSATGVVLQADGKLIVGGSAGSDFAIVRYNVNGTVDTTFGTNGVITTSVGPGVDLAIGIALQTDGKIVVGGHAQSAINGPQDFALVRYNADGSLDVTFRAEERLAATEGTPFVYTIPANRFVDPDGDALTLSATQSNGNALPSWLAFDAATRSFSGTAPAGSADVHVRVTAVDPAGLSASYAYWIHANAAPQVVVAPGVTTTNILVVGGSIDNAAAVALQPDGKILLTGMTSAVMDTPVVRYNPDGSLDLSFAGDGIVTINTNTAPFGGSDLGRALAVQPDGRILVAGVSGNDLALSRINANGSIDPSFGGGDGIAVTNIPGGTTDFAQAMTLQADSKILVTGRTTVGAENQLVLVRHNTDGSLDTTFDTDGIVVAAVGLNADEGFSVKTQADGKIVVSGYSAVGLEHSMLVARFNADGSLDSSFGGDGIVTTDIGPGLGAFPPNLVIPGVAFEAGQALAILPDGRVVVAGFGPTPAGGTDIALVRYNTDGSLDTTFGAGGVVTTAVSAGAIVDRALGVALQPDGRLVVSAAVVTPDGGGDIGVLRYLSDGTLDATFGGDGIVTVAIGPGMSTDQANGVAIQADGRIVVGATALLGFVGANIQDFAAVRLNPDGSLDTTFGGIGSPVVTAGQSFSWTVQRFFTDADNDALTYSLTMSDGSALPAWATFNGTALNGIAPLGAADLALRLTATDPWGASATQSFVLRVESPNAAPVVNYAVPAGIVLAPIGPGNSADLATGMVVQPNGKIVVVGQSSTAETSQDFTVVRYNADGSFDTTFGGDGIVVTPVAAGSGTDAANSVALQSDGKIVVAGTNSSDFAVTRYNADGSLDATFGGDGIVTTALGPASSRDEALRVTVQSDGKIVVVGYAQNSTAVPPPAPPQSADIAVVRYNADGSLDTTFGGGDGIVTTEIGTSLLADVASAVFVQADGGIVVAGFTTSPTGPTTTGQDFVLARYTASGVLDATFGGGDGIVTTAVVPGNVNDQARSILQQPDGRVVIVGQTGNDFALARYNTDGTPDATFGTNGVVVHSVSIGADVATGVVRQADGKLLVGGWSGLDFAIVRYNVNGTVDTTFGTSGIITTSVGPAADIAIGIAVQADGKIVLGGHGSPAGTFDFALVRYNADGSLDATFRAEERVVATEDRPFAYTIPADRFVDPDADVLTFSAVQTNGSALPSWLGFDAATRTFSGTAPAGSGDVHVRVTATDPDGLSASNAYWIYTNTAPNVVGPSGVVTTNLVSPQGANGSDVAAAVSLQADGKILLTGSTSAISDTHVVRLNADGSLDLGFSADGILTVNTISAGADNGRSIIAQPDGRILIASNTGSDISVTRVFADGLFLDGSFGGGDGIATTNILGASADFAQSMTLQADGKILVTGRMTVAPENQLVVVRHNTDGTLDATFDGDGIAIVPVAMNVDDGFSIKTQADGKIVVSGYGATSAVEHSIIVARFNDNGSLDTSFDADGIVRTDIGVGPGTIPIIPNFTFSEAGQGVAIQTDGRIVVAGYGPTAAGGTDIALVRYNTDGSLDATFGTGGVVTTAVSAGTGVDRAFGVALQTDGRIVVAAGVVTAEGGQDIGVLRYNGDGTLDTTFGGDGIVTVAIGPGQQTEITTCIVIQPDGRIVVGGSTQFALNGSTGMDFAAVRLNPDGSLDTTFGGIGTPVANAGQQFSWTVQRFIADADTDPLIYTMAQADGSPLPAGLTFTGTALNGAVAAGTGDLALRLTATDPYGAEASQYFVLDVIDPLAPPDDGDTFAFDDGFGQAMVTGFTAGDSSGDVLDLSGLTNPEWTDFADIMALTTQVDSNAVIDLGHGNTITLVGVTASNLTADDFRL